MNDNNTMTSYLEEYQEAMRIRHFSEATVYGRTVSIRRFISWCETRDLTTPQQIDVDVIESYQRHLYYFKKEGTDKPLSHAFQRSLLSAVKQFFKYLARKKVILFNPLSEIDLPKERQTLPQQVLTVDEVNKLLEQPNVGTPFGIRNRAILELLYSTAIRRLECIRLEVHDLDLNRETVFIKQGKGGKDRILPVGKRAIHWLERYINEVRPFHSFGQEKARLFLNQFGKPMTKGYLSDMVSQNIKKAGISKAGTSCHALRHSAATHMLDNQCDIRFIQAMLGHAELNTTQIYTKVSIEKLRQVHRRTHPSGGN